MNIPIFNLNSIPKKPVTGQVRVNTTNLSYEIYDGTRWQSVVQNWTPVTWLEWFDYYIKSAASAADEIRRDYIEQEMQGRFPGRYHIELLNERWTMVFDNPADETWWHLKYD